VRQDITVTAEVRTSRGKNEARRTRRAGLIPAVVYGAYKEPVSVALDPREITKITRSKSGYNTIFNLAVKDGETTPVMVLDRQVDPIKGYLLHADLKRIDLTKRIKVTVPVHTSGDAKGVKVQGGLLEIITRSIEIECLPDEIPLDFTVDVTELMIGQSKRASDVGLSGSMKLLGQADTVIAHVVALRAEEVAPAAETAAVTPAAGAAGSEPEVIKKGKKEEEAAGDKGKPAADKGKEKEKDKGKKK
jgi:large subunit ribosomal protein L25